jgi:ABC-type dipeptide/oligopeptide/nickel transport system permease component
LVRYILVRMLAALPTLLCLTMLVFVLTTSARGDPALILLEQSDQPATPELLAFYRAELGLDDPLPVRYLRWLGNALQGDLGRSFLTQRPVTDMLAERVVPTLTLGLVAFAVATLGGVGLGALLATSRQPWADLLVRLALCVLAAIPSFWLAIGLIFFLGVQWRLLPVAGQGSWQHIVMPAVALSFGSMVVMLRLTRSAVLEVLREDYVRTAHAKGLAPRLVTLRHILRNAALPLTTLIGMRFGTLLTGAVIIESIFAWPGLGSVFITAVAGRDLPVIGGYILLIGLPIIAANLLADVFCHALDPRINLADTAGGRA